VVVNKVKDMILLHKVVIWPFMMQEHFQKIHLLDFKRIFHFTELILLLLTKKLINLVKPILKWVCSHLLLIHQHGKVNFKKELNFMIWLHLYQSAEMAQWILIPLGFLVYFGVVEMLQINQMLFSNKSTHQVKIKTQ